MRDMLQTQEHMDVRLKQRDEELWQLRSQSQVDGAQLAVLSLQMQELISSVESRAEVVGRDCQEIGLVAIMFFFELLFFLCSSQFPSIFPLLTYSQ